MEKVGCTISGTLNDSKFSEPMPWIGLYVVAASTACAIAMSIDAFHGFRYRKFWFPCRFFALNATTLTLIAVAVKLSVDLNTPMPRPYDQLTKLSSNVFICTVMGNSLPSLGTMQNKELMMNVFALGILVITVIVNVFIQLGTGVIYVFFIEHVVVMFLMVVLFAIIVSSALAIPATKYYLDLKYNKKYEIAKKESISHVNDSIIQRLTYDLERYWVMAHTCNPQFVVGRLATCTASGAFCLLSALVLAEAVLRRYLMPWCFRFCDGESDYKWSSFLILVSQAVAVIVGTIAPAWRWFTAINFRCPKKANRACRVKCLWVEKYWIKKLHQLKESPLDLRICGRQGRKLVYNMKNKVLDTCIWTQKTVVVLSKSVRMISIYSVYCLLIFHQSCKKLAGLFRRTNTIRDFDAESETEDNCKLDLSRYVLHLEGEEELIGLMPGCANRHATGHWIRMGRKKQPRYLIRLLEEFSPSPGFEGVYNFDSYQVPSLDSEEPPNCWALPVVTLTSIAVAVSNTDFHSVKELIKCVHEGLIYIRVVENNLDIKKDLVNVRKAAEILWAGVELHYKWLDVELREMAIQGTPRDIISELSGIAKGKFLEYRKTDITGCLRDNPSNWPCELLTANSMYRVCQTLLLTTDHKSNECSKVMFKRLATMIADIMAAGLTNLQHAISIKCHQSSIEEREEIVRSGILLLGKSEKILEILSFQPLPSSDPEHLACINEWRALSKVKDHVTCDSSPTSSDSNSSTSHDLYLNIV